MRKWTCDSCPFSTYARDKYELARNHRIDFGVDIDDFEEAMDNIVRFLDHNHE